ncbi:MAG: hypothetical protein ABSF13_14305 [Smithella sp.]|jgi:hypothetical protein
MSKKKKNANKNKTTHPVNDPINIRNNRPPIMSSFFAFSEKLASSRYLKWLMIALLPVLILLIYRTNGRDYDLWWQMALGKYYLTYHTLIVDHSIFSWTPADPGWIYNTCLGSIFVYLAYSLMGGFGLWVFQWLVFLGIFLSFYLFFRLLCQRLDVTGVTLIAAIGFACSATCDLFKPELFSPLLFSWTLFIFFYVKLTHRKFLFYLYPLIFALWVNLHGAFVVGLVFLALAFIGELLNRVFFPQESFTIKDLTHLGAACVLSLVATLLNPYGMDYLLPLLNLLMVNPHDIVSTSVKAYGSLWPYLKNINGFFYCMSMGQVVWIMFLMMFFLGCLFLYELIKKKSCDLALLIVNAALYWKGMQTIRASYFFPIAFFFSFFYLLHRLKLKSIPGRATILSLLVFVFFFVNISYFTLIYSTDTKWFGAGLDSFVPVKEVALLKKFRLEGPIFNDYTIGGYLIWDLYPDYKVFIDSRGNGPFGKQVFPDYIDFIYKPVTSESIQRFREKYPFKIAIIHYNELPLIFDFLRAGDEWRLLYFEQNAAILIHKSLLPAISPEFRTTVDVSPQRFKDVKNQEVLINVFKFYVHLNPMAGRVIYDIYKNNVSDYYKLKEENLQKMDSLIRLYESKIKP